MRLAKKPLKVWLLVGVALIIAAASLGGCASSDDDGATTTTTTTPPVEKPVIKFADTQFESLWINNAIVQYIMEEGYGYETESVEMTTPIYQLSLVNGDIDIMLELWQQNNIVWYDEEIAAGTIENVGDAYEGGPQFFIIPVWVHEQYNINTIEDMKANWELFKDPEDPDKGAFINCPIGWQCAEVNEVKMGAYGLMEMYNVINPGSGGALDAALAGPMEKEQAVFGYHWSPTALMGLYDWYILEEPAYDAAIWAKVAAAQLDDSLRPIDEACAYETLPVDIGITATLRERAPELVTMLEKTTVGVTQINQTAAWAKTEEIAGEWDLAAIYYLNNWEERWTSWVTADAATKIKAALAKE